MLVTRYVSVNESYGYVLDVGTGELTEVNPTSEKASFGRAVWDARGQGVYFTSDGGGEFKQLRYCDLDGGGATLLTGDVPWDVESVEISRRADRLAFTANEGGTGALYLLDTATGAYGKISGVPVGQVYGLEFDPDGERLAFVANTPRTPGGVYVLTVADHSIERWTFSEVGGLDTGSFIVPGLIQYETFDTVGRTARTIPAFYYRPAAARSPFPVLIDIHGGSEGQYVPDFSSITQYAVCELGIAVLAPNVRGSSGYGKNYLELDNGYRREDCVKDIGAALDWIERQPELDASRVAVLGGSYGGYMVLAAMMHYNDRIRAGIDIVGISNFVTFLENTQGYRRDLRRVECGDERDARMREFLVAISPLTHAAKITKPMLIVQGLNDPRVPVGESEQMVEAIRRNGQAVWYILARDEGHGFHKKQNSDYLFGAVAFFCEEHLLR